MKLRVKNRDRKHFDLCCLSLFILLINNLGGLSFCEDATGKYVVGADSVPKNWVAVK